MTRHTTRLEPGIESHEAAMEIYRAEIESIQKAIMKNQCVLVTGDFRTGKSSLVEFATHNIKNTVKTDLPYGLDSLEKRIKYEINKNTKVFIIDEASKLITENLKEFIEIIKKLKKKYRELSIIIIVQEENPLQKKSEEYELNYPPKEHVDEVIKLVDFHVKTEAINLTREQEAKLNR